MIRLAIKRISDGHYFDVTNDRSWNLPLSAENVFSTSVQEVQNILRHIIDPDRDLFIVFVEETPVPTTRYTYTEVKEP